MSLSPAHNPATRASNPMLIIGMLFFVFGFITWLGSVLIPYLRIACELNNFESYLVAFSFYISYFIMAIPSAWVLSKTGYKKGISLGLLIMSAGTFLFIPAALMRNYLMFLAGLFVQGSGMSILQTAANPYVTILGPRESAARRISMMGICNGIAGVSAPLILGAVMLQDAEGTARQAQLLAAPERSQLLSSLAHKVIMPYGIMMVALILLSVMVHYSRLPELDHDETEEQGDASSAPSTKSIIHHPRLILGVITLFFYVGVEVIAVDTVISYAAFRGLPLSEGKFFATLTLVNMLAGYVVGVLLIPRIVSQKRAFQVCSVLGVAFTLCALFIGGIASVAFVSLLGLANSLMWPSIWPIATEGLGSHMKKGAALLIMAIGGGALVPLLYGKLADTFNPHEAYWLLLPCYLLILYYAFRAGRFQTS